MSKKPENPFLLKFVDKTNASYITKTEGKNNVVFAVYCFVDPKLLKLSEYHPRVTFDLEGLESSIENDGIKEELQINEKDNGDLIVIDGARRRAASINKKLEEVPIIIKKYTDREEQEAILINSIQHKDLTPIELAKALKDYKEKYKLSNVEVGERFFPHQSQADTSSSGGAITGASQKVGKYLKLLELPPKVQTLINEGFPIEKAVIIARLKFDKEGEESVEWQLVRVNKQIELAEANLSFPNLEKTVKELIESEKQLRAQVKEDLKKKEDLLVQYTEELRNEIESFLGLTKLQFPIPEKYADFNINKLGEKKNQLIAKLKNDLIDQDKLVNYSTAITSLNQLISVIKKESSLEKLMGRDTLNSIYIQVNEIYEHDSKKNQEVSESISEINVAWQKISRVWQKIGKAFEAKASMKARENKENSESRINKMLSNF